MWVCEVEEGGEREVPACGVAGEKDVGWGAPCLGEDVAEGGDGLAELSWVDGGWGETVGDEEDGDVVAGCVEGGDQLVVEVEVCWDGGEDEAAAFFCFKIVYVSLFFIFFFFDRFMWLIVQTHRGSRRLPSSHPYFRSSGLLRRAGAQRSPVEGVCLS